MGTFQGYKFLAVDKPLTNEERQSVASLSSRSNVSSTSARFVYHYGDFRGNPMNVLREYFDLHLYFANWGTKQLMLKFPIDSVDYWALKKYEIQFENHATCALSLNKSSKHVILDLEWNDENGGGWMDIDDYDLSDFVFIREAIMNGDYGTLFLFWLKLAAIKYDPDFEDFGDEDFDEDDERLGFGNNTQTPPIPSNLEKQKYQLKAFTDFFEIEENLVDAAIKTSKRYGNSPQKIDYKSLITKMSETEKDRFLMQILAGETRLDIQLKKHLDKVVTIAKHKDATVSLQEIFDLQMGANQEIIATKEAEEARKLQIKIDKTAREENEIWEDVFFNLDHKIAKTYDLAIEMLVDLKALAVYRNDLKSFEEKIRGIKAKYGRSKVLLNRFEKVGL
jgi:hypothetical protein